MKEDFHRKKVTFQQIGIGSNGDLVADDQTTMSLSVSLHSEWK